MATLWAILLVLALLFCWLLTMIGIPGNWLMIVAVLFYILFGPDEGRLQMHWGWVVGLVGLASLGELFEFLAGALGAAKMGGSKRGASLAFVGSLIGGIAGLFVGLPIPVVGQLVAALLFACLGALVGALIGEKWKGRGWKESFQIGGAAAVGRLLGTVGKVAFGLLMIAAVCVALLF